MDNSASTPPEKEPQPNKAGIRTGYVLGGIAWLVCFVAAWQLAAFGPAGPSEATGWLNILVCLFGSIVGWWLGILLSPDPTERGKFSTVLKTLSTFVSGFALAKIDVLFQGAVAKNMTTDPIFIGRILFFTTTALICAQFTYVARHDLGMYGVQFHSEATFWDRRLRFLARHARRKGKSSAPKR
jgi:hypothetical protein